MADDKYIKIGPVADSVPFDNENDPDCGLTGVTVQEVIEELCKTGGKGVSPGFTWGRSGNLPPGTWLLNDTVPSNVVGRRVSFNDVFLEEVSVANQKVTTFKIEIYEHDGTIFTLLHTLSITVAARGGESTGLNIPVTTGKELAVRVADSSPNAPKNADVTVQLKGTTA